MRKVMLVQSSRNDLKLNVGADSEGWIGEDRMFDESRLSGGRVTEGLKAIPESKGSWLGGWQGGKQYPFGWAVPESSWADHLMAAYRVDRVT
jgi:hypothetical protein